MSVTFRQIAGVADGTGSVVLSVNSTFGSANILANRLVLLANWANDASATTDTCAIVDTAGNSWNQIGATTHEAVGSWGASYYACFEVPSCKASASNTVTLNVTSPSNAAIFLGFGCVELTGSNPSAASYGLSVTFDTSCSCGPAEATIAPASVGDMVVGWGAVTNPFGATGVVSGNTQRGGFFGTHCGGDMYAWSELVAASLANLTVGVTFSVNSTWGYQAVAVPVATGGGISVPFWAAP